MPYDGTEARAEMLGEISRAADDLAAALAALGEAYEQLDDDSADRLEEELFGPIQTAYGRAKRTHSGFAARTGLPEATFAPASPGHPSQGVAGFLESAVEDVASADHVLSELQDSMRPVEVGDAELRAGLSEVRRLLADVPARARGFSRTFGR
jgi:hypothetical protein